jgi:phospholipase C
VKIRITQLVLPVLFLLILGYYFSNEYIYPYSFPNTPIKHIVVIVQEDISFDHYFGTYPNAANPPGEPKFTPYPNTPSINGLNSTLLYHNPNSANPFRIDRSSFITCSMNHNYTSEQSAYHGGANKFIEYVGPTAPASCTDSKHKQQVMGIL